MSANFVKAVQLKTLSSASVNGTYQAVNAGGLPHSCFTLRVMNASDKDITVSYDGVTDNELIIAGQTLQVNAQENSQPNNNVCLFAKGTTVYVKGTAGTGTIAVSAYFQP